MIFCIKGMKFYSNWKRIMTIDEEIKRRIIDLHSNEHVTNRKISKIVKKSSRDIIAVLKVSENKEIADEIIESTLYQGDYQFVKEKVLVIADKTFHKLTKDLAENTLSTAAGLEKGISYSVEMVESETADAAS